MVFSTQPRRVTQADPGYLAAGKRPREPTFFFADEPQAVIRTQQKHSRCCVATQERSCASGVRDRRNSKPLAVRPSWRPLWPWALVAHGICSNTESSYATHIQIIDDYMTALGLAADTPLTQDEFHRFLQSRV